MPIIDLSGGRLVHPDSPEGIEAFRVVWEAALKAMAESPYWFWTDSLTSEGREMYTTHCCGKYVWIKPHQLNGNEIECPACKTILKRRQSPPHDWLREAE